eukprot:jgi/Phyca11/537879/estExt2_fgenesh1_pg.C_PHYCAscaffold_6840001
MASSYNFGDLAPPSSSGSYLAPPAPQLNRDRRKYEDLADLFAIFKTTEHLEAAYVRDAITPEEIQPLLSEMMSSLTMVSGLPPDFSGRDKIEGWLRTMNAMRASEELDEEQARQLSFDLERAYSSFMAFLNK